MSSVGNGMRGMMKKSFQTMMINQDRDREIAMTYEF